MGYGGLASVACADMRRATYLSYGTFFKREEGAEGPTKEESPLFAAWHV